MTKESKRAKSRLFCGGSEKSRFEQLHKESFHEALGRALLEEEITFSFIF